MDLFDEEELLAQMQTGNFMEEDEDDDAGLDYLREMEEQEAKVKKALFQSRGGAEEPKNGLGSSDSTRQLHAKRPRDLLSSDSDAANNSLPLAELPDDLENLDAFSLPMREKADLASLKSPCKKRAKHLDDLTNKPRSVGIGGRPRYDPDLTVIYRRVPEFDFQSITCSDGERFYLRLKEKDSLPGETEDTIKMVQSGGGLCGVSFDEMRQQAVIEQSKMEAKAREMARTRVQEDRDSGCESMDEEGAASLWVEKFRPRSFIQLLSDDGTNRILLQWLKLWDKVVFGREPKVRVKKSEQQAAEEEQKSNFKKFGDGKNDEKKKKFKKFNEPELILDLDSSNRPMQKVALLHGPPGLGKTTLAHVIANHAGYNVVEMNASDDRALATFKTKLDAATQMQSVLKRDQRPNCLVIDEIDGSPAATINHLVNLITGKGAGGGKKGKKAELLQRPIICICNDLWVPSLRPLKALCMVVPFPPTLSQRLSSRLMEIAKKERLQTDMTTLLALCEKTDNDIRSCLSTLQFSKSRGKPLRLVDVQQASVGQKDSHLSHFTVWKKLFEISRANKKFVREIRGQVVQVEESGASLPNRFKSTLHSVYACGEYEKLMQGVFENYLNVKFKDSQFDNVINGTDWFCFFDESQQLINRTQNYTMMGYQPFVFVSTHMLFGSFTRGRIMYPSTHMEKKNALQKSHNVISSMISEMSPHARAFVSTSNLLFDVLPLLMEILQPNLRPVNTQLYSPREKAELRHLVEVMVAYNLQYVQERTMEGQYEYRLDPGVEDLAYFPETRHHASLTYALKQLVAREVDIEKMRDRNKAEEERERESGKNKLGKESARTARGEKAAFKSENSSAPKNSEGEKAVPNHLQKLKAKALDVEVVERSPVDFFGRTIVISEAKREEMAKKDANTEIVSSDIWFKFKEGYNNAVRRNVKMKDLL